MLRKNMSIKEVESFKNYQTLTDFEKKIVILYCVECLTNKQIGIKLNCVERTIVRYKQKITEKLS